jgi:hypothetical protein
MRSHFCLQNLRWICHRNWGEMLCSLRKFWTHYWNAISQNWGDTLSRPGNCDQIISFNFSFVHPRISFKRFSFHVEWFELSRQTEKSFVFLFQQSWNRSIASSTQPSEANLWICWSSSHCPHGHPSSNFKAISHLSLRFTPQMLQPSSLRLNSWNHQWVINLLQNDFRSRTITKTRNQQYDKNRRFLIKYWLSQWLCLESISFPNWECNINEARVVSLVCDQKENVIILLWISILFLLHARITTHFILILHWMSSDVESDPVSAEQNLSG